MQKSNYVASFLVIKKDNIYHGVFFCTAFSHAEAYGIIKQKTISRYPSYEVHIANITSLDSIDSGKLDIQEFETH